MLQIIREKTHGWIAGIIISLLILSFALWGIHSYLEGSGVSNVVAKVNNIEITKDQLSVAYDRLRRQLQMQTGSAILPSDVEAALKARALQNLINMQILKRSSLKNDYRISDLQVDSLLETMPEFQVNGVFSMSRFQQALSAALFTASDFIELLKTSLLIDQPRLGLIFSSFALPDEVSLSAALVNQERSIQYAILFTKNISTPIAISSDQIKTYYQAHANEFQIPERASIEYVELSTSHLLSTIHPSEAELKTFYNENIDMFSENKKQLSFEQAKEKVKAALVKQLAEEKFASLKDKLANMTYEHPDSLNFASQALQLPIKTSAEFTKEKGAKDISADSKIRQITFSNDVLVANNNSDVIQLTPDVAIVLRVKTHTSPSVLPLKEVETQIADKLQLETRQAQAYKQAAEIKNKLAAGQSLSSIANEFHLSWNNGGFISRHATKIDPAILNEAFAMPKPSGKESTYSFVKTTNGYAVIALNAVKNGVLKDKEQYDLFAEQIQNTEGVLEYDFYKNDLIKNSKIVIENKA